jgi:hydroxymethylglutaryl-CoA lyase
VSDYPDFVKVVEVSPRDGLQNEKQPVSTETKIELINRLSGTGLKTIESTSFVSPKWIPQLADADDVFRRINKKDGVHYPVLVPNMKGMDRALDAGVSEIAVFTAASETFNQKNINASIKESIDRIAPVMESASDKGIKVRGYISCVLGCPYEGDVDVEIVAAVAGDLRNLGCYEISLGDTIGVGNPKSARAMLARVADDIEMRRLAIHFHDTRGLALINIQSCLELGVAVVDGSVAGLGGCPYAHGASGNVASDDLVYMLHRMSIDTGIDLDALVDTGLFISQALGKAPSSKLGQVAWYKQQDQGDSNGAK